VSCRNPDCAEHLVPKDVTPDLEPVAGAGDAICGACGQPVTVD
jgi:hypothetical protein